MKIRLLCDLPERPEQGLTKGRVCKVMSGPQEPAGGWYVMGDAGSMVIVYGHQAEVVRKLRALELVEGVRGGRVSGGGEGRVWRWNK